MRNVEAPLSMTMGVDDGKRAKSASRRGRVTDDISPAAVAAGLAGSVGGEGFGAFGNLFLFAASSSSSSPLGDSRARVYLGMSSWPSTPGVLGQNPLSFHIICVQSIWGCSDV